MTDPGRLWRSLAAVAWLQGPDWGRKTGLALIGSGFACLGLLGFVEVYLGHVNQFGGMIFLTVSFSLMFAGLRLTDWFQAGW